MTSWSWPSWVIALLEAFEPYALELEYRASLPAIDYGEAA